MFRELLEHLRRAFGDLDVNPPDMPRALPAQSPLGSLPPGSSFCLVVNPLGKDRSVVLSVLDETGVRFEEVPEEAVMNLSVTKRAPNMVIYAFEDREELAESLRALGRSNFDGAVQPIARTPEAAAALRADPLIPGGTARALPAIESPVSRAALKEAVEFEGLARTPAGNVAVSLGVALKNKWMEFWYQPKVDLTRMALVGAETLARVRHPSQGLVMPSAFLARATDCELRLLGMASIRAALRDWTAFQKLGFNLTFAVNTPLSTLDTSEFISIVKTTRPPDRKWPGLHLEVESNEVANEPGLVRDRMAALKRENFHLVIDNFGLDGSTAIDLSRLPVAELKIHQQLVRGCASNSAQRLACKGVVDLARANKATAVASGLEAAVDLAYVKSIGCDAGQGNLFASPLDRVGFMTLLQSKAGKKAV